MPPAQPSALPEAVPKSVPSPSIPPEAEAVYKRAERMAYVLRRWARLPAASLPRPSLLSARAASLLADAPCRRAAVPAASVKTCAAKPCVPASPHLPAALAGRTWRALTPTRRCWPSTPRACSGEGAHACCSALQAGTALCAGTAPLLCACARALFMCPAPSARPPPPALLLCRSDRFALRDPFVECGGVRKALEYMARVRRRSFVPQHAWCLQVAGMAEREGRADAACTATPTARRTPLFPKPRSCASLAPIWRTPRSCCAAARTSECGKQQTASSLFLFLVLPAALMHLAPIPCRPLSFAPSRPGSP